MVISDPRHTEASDIEVVVCAKYVCTYIVYKLLSLSKMLAQLYYGSRISESFGAVFAIL